MENYNDEPRVITKFEKESLKDWWVNGYADQYSIEENEFFYKKWFDGLNWSEIDEIVEQYK